VFGVNARMVSVSRMFSIGGNMHVSAYKDTKYEPLGLILEAQEEVRSHDTTHEGHYSQLDVC